MPKLKTHKASKKRMKVTKNGKVLRAKANKSHLNSSKSGKRIRQLRKATTVHSTLESKYRSMIDV